jgi:glycosyltransferase involved in cell wall biosynthesis
MTGDSPSRGLSASHSLPPRPTVSVVIPTLNEAQNLEHVFDSLPEGIKEVIIVDGHSVDNTIAVARSLRPDVQIVMQNRRGKGNALACGFAVCTGDVIVMIDADGSTDAAEIPRYVDALKGGAHFAKGSRFIEGGFSHDITRLRKAGNRALNGLVNLLFGTNYTDLCYGYNAFWRDLTPYFCLDVGEPGVAMWGDGFEVETLINVRVARAGAAITEVPSIEHARVHGESNLNAWRDGWRVLRTIARERGRRSSASPNLAAVTLAGHSSRAVLDLVDRTSTDRSTPAVEGVA